MVLVAQDRQAGLDAPLFLVCVEPTSSLGNAAEIVRHFAILRSVSVGKSGKFVDVCLWRADLWYF